MHGFMLRMYLRFTSFFFQIQRMKNKTSNKYKYSHINADVEIHPMCICCESTTLHIHMRMSKLIETCFQAENLNNYLCNFKKLSN